MDIKASVEEDLKQTSQCPEDTKVTKVAYSGLKLTFPKRLDRHRAGERYFEKSTFLHLVLVVVFKCSAQLHQFFLKRALKDALLGFKPSPLHCALSILYSIYILPHTVQFSSTLYPLHHLLCKDILSLWGGMQHPEVLEIDPLFIMQQKHRLSRSNFVFYTRTPIASI